MASTVDGISAVTKLRRSVLDVQRELEAKRADYEARVARVREGEEQLGRDRAELQDTLVQYYKFIQENEIKRSRATKKSVLEERQRKEREEQIAELAWQLQNLDGERDTLRSHHGSYAKYQQFLEEVLSRNDGDEYLEPKDIIQRWMTLQDNTKVLQQRKTQLEEDLLRNKSALNVARQRQSNESVSLQNELNELQMTLETQQKSIKIHQDDLERRLKQKSATTRMVSHVSMAAKNLYDRCLLWTEPYSGRGKSESTEGDALRQLHIIADCLEDFQAIIARHLELRISGMTAI